MPETMSILAKPQVKRATIGPLSGAKEKIFQPTDLYFYCVKSHEDYAQKIKYSLGPRNWFDINKDVVEQCG